MIWNLGSINVDWVYHLPHLPTPGETLAASSTQRGLGGKGANMSVAVARAGARVAHIGAVGPDGAWAIERLLEYGVDTRPIKTLDAPTGHAIIAVDPAGENQIIILPGANAAISMDDIASALANAGPGDTLLLQNETNGQSIAAQTARRAGMRVVYAAAPFSAAAVTEVLPFIDLLILNEVEAQQLGQALGRPAEDMGVDNVVVTHGADGSVWHGVDGSHVVPAVPATPVDTTGAGDVFTGYVVACLDRGMPMMQALDMATRAAAIMVTRYGTADVIPDLKDIEDARLA